MMRRILGLLSDSAVYGFSSLIGQVVGFLLLPLYTRFLSPADYGVLAMLAIVTMLFGPVANLGMTSAIFRRFHREKHELRRQTVSVTGLVSVALASAALLLATQLLAPAIAALVVGDVDKSPLVRLTLLSVALASVSEVPVVILRARRRVILLALMNLARLCVNVGVTVALVVGARLGVLGVVLGTLAGDALLLVPLLTVTRSWFRGRFSPDMWRRMISYGLPFLPHRIQAAAIVLFGQYAVRSMLGLDQAGLYNVAVKFAAPIAFVVNAVQSAWVPYKFQMHAEERDPAGFFRTAVSYYFVGLGYLWVGVSVWGPEVVRLFTPADYHSAALLVPAVGLIPVAQGLHFMLGTGLELSDDTRPLPLVSLLGLVTVVVATYLLIGPLGAWGAAYATVCGWAAMAAVMYHVAQRRYAVHYDWFVLGSVGLAAVAMVSLSHCVQPAPLWLRLAIALSASLAYPLVMGLILLRSSTERPRLVAAWRRWRLCHAASTGKVGEEMGPCTRIG